MLAADVELAEKLAELARKHRTSLFSLTNRLIESYAVLERAGYADPLEAATDLLVLETLLAAGFKLQPPEREGPGAWESLGEALWMLASSRSPSLDPKAFLVKLASALAGRKSVVVEASSSTSVVVSPPPGSPLKPEQLAGVLRGAAKSALGDCFEEQEKGGVLFFKILEGCRP